MRGPTFRQYPEPLRSEVALFYFNQLVNAKEGTAFSKSLRLGNLDYGRYPEDVINAIRSFCIRYGFQVSNRAFHKENEETFYDLTFQRCAAESPFIDELIPAIS